MVIMKACDMPKTIVTMILAMALVCVIGEAFPLFAQNEPAAADEAFSVSSDQALKSHPDGLAPQVSIPIKIDLIPEARATDERIYLGTIARCAGAGGFCDEIYGIDLGIAPQPGKTVLVTKTAISELLRREWPQAAVTITGKDIITVFADSVDVDQETVRRSLQDAIRLRFGEIPDLRITVTKIQLASPIKTRPGDYHLEFPLLETENPRDVDWVVQRLNGTVTFDVRYVPDGEPARAASTFWTTAMISIEKKIPTAHKNLAAGKILSIDDFEPNWVAVSRSGNRFLDKTSDFEGMKLRTSLAVGQPLLISQVEVPIAVRQGSTVRTIVRSENLEVFGRAEARGSGGIGQSIDIVYPGTNKRFQALIIGKDLVEVTF